MAGLSGKEVEVGTRLGWLYLEQGHLNDAEMIFRAVLGSRPDDADARSGLEAARQRRSEGGADPAQERSPTSVAERKIARLESYLAGLRRVSQSEAGGLGSTGGGD